MRLKNLPPGATAVLKSKLKLNHKWINHHALGIVKALQEQGFETYLVGGCVRDLLVGIEPKDFDISTTARPRQVRKFIGNSFIIGRRFRLVLAKRDDEQFEISTFRRAPTPDDIQEDSGIEGDNLFGTPEEDAYRRDFTLNALFYDPITEEVVDYTGGMKDLKARKLKMIGDPEERLLEDPIRILRAIRLAHKTNCSIECNLKQNIARYASSLTTSVLPRRREEILKFLRLKDPYAAFIQMYDLGVLKYLSPSLEKVFDSPKASQIFYDLCKRFTFDFRKNCPPHYLFLILVTSLALKETNCDLESIEDWCRQEPQQNFFKHELGLFNVEASAITQAFKILSQMTDIQMLSRKGLRRQVGFLSQKSFPLALTVGRYVGQLTDFEADEWSSLYLKYEKEWTSLALSDKNKE